MNSTASLSARSFTPRSGSCRTISTNGSEVTMRNGRIKAAGVSARRRRKHSLTPSPLRGQKRSLPDHRQQQTGHLQQAPPVRSSTSYYIFLRLAGDAGACRASFAGNQAAGAGGSEGARSELRQALCQRGAAVDPAGAIAERLAASGVLLDPLGTPTDGAARL